MFYLAVILGCLIFLLLQLNKAYMKPDFSWKIFGKSIWIPTLLNLVIGFAMVFGRDEIQLIYKITFISSIALGVAGQAILKGVFETFSKDVATVL